MTLIIVYILFVLIGITLGLIGGGGSVLAVPVLVYVLDLPANEATSFSLFIVGATSLTATYSNVSKGNFSFEALLQFGIPSVISIFFTRKYIMPSIPNEVFTIGSYVVTKNILILVVFSVLMLLSAYSMLRKTKTNKRVEAMWDEFSRTPIRLPFIVLIGIIVGAISGFVGAGGGFLIIPALMFFVRVNMKLAIGTSLTIIAINALVGFFSTLGQFEIDWPRLITLTSFCILGIFVGTFLGNYINGKKLKPAFGYLTLAVGLFIICKEVFFNK